MDRPPCILYPAYTFISRVTQIIHKAYISSLLAILQSQGAFLHFQEPFLYSLTTYPDLFQAPRDAGRACCVCTQALISLARGVPIRLRMGIVWSIV